MFTLCLRGSGKKCLEFPWGNCGSLGFALGKSFESLLNARGTVEHTWGSPEGKFFPQTISWIFHTPSLYLCSPPCAAALTAAARQCH